MNIQKALDLIQLAKSHQCKLFLAPPDQLRWSCPVMPPHELLEELRANKRVLLEYYQQTNRDLTPLVKRAYDGYYYCLNQAQLRREYHVRTLHWRSTVQQVLQLNYFEMAIIEKLLIQNDQLQYIGNSNEWLIAYDLSQHYCFDTTDTALDDELKEFVYC